MPADLASKCTECLIFRHYVNGRGATVFVMESWRLDFVGKLASANNLSRTVAEGRGELGSGFASRRLGWTDHSRGSIACG